MLAEFLEETGPGFLEFLYLVGLVMGEVDRFSPVETQVVKFPRRILVGNQ